MHYRKIILQKEYKFVILRYGERQDGCMKYQKVMEDLRMHIEKGDFADANKLPTEDNLCTRYGVSRQTVRHALSLLEQEGLIRRQQGSGSHIVRAETASPRQRVIAVITTYISDYIFPSILREIETVLAKNNSRPMLFATQNQVISERNVLTSLLSLPQLDGILVEGTKTALPNPNLDLYRKLLARNIPIVFMNGNYRELEVPSVLDDNFGGGYMLVQHLYNKGHRNIAGVFKSDDIQGHQRYAGYAQAMLECGLVPDDAHICWYTTESKEGITAWQEPFAQQIISALSGCSAVVCYNDEIAVAVLSAMLRQGLRIPEDLAVVSFDNSKYSEIGPLRITSLSHGENNVGRLAAQMLVEQLNGGVLSSCLAPWTLVVRDSD